jgi:hypothetical protein
MTKEILADFLGYIEVLETVIQETGKINASPFIPPA